MEIDYYALSKRLNTLFLFEEITGYLKDAFKICLLNYDKTIEFKSEAHLDKLASITINSFVERRVNLKSKFTAIESIKKNKEEVFDFLQYDLWEKSINLKKYR
jgi:hypothetical protein